MTTQTTAPAVSAPILVRADCTQLGLSVDASRDGGKSWQLVQLTPYTVRQTPTVRAYSTAIDPARDRADYSEAFGLATVKPAAVGLRNMTSPAALADLWGRSKSLC